MLFRLLNGSPFDQEDLGYFLGVLCSCAVPGYGE